MLSIRCLNSQKSENTQTSVVNSNFFFLKFVENMIHHYSHQAFMILVLFKVPIYLFFSQDRYFCTAMNHQAFIILVLFTLPFYHFLFSRYLDLTERHFSSDILVPFPDSSDFVLGKTHSPRILQLQAILISQLASERLTVYSINCR